MYLAILLKNKKWISFNGKNVSEVSEGVPPLWEIESSPVRNKKRRRLVPS